MYSRYDCRSSHTQETDLVMALRSIRLPPADTILFILTHSQIYWVNFRAHINAGAPAAWHFSSAAETCTRIYTLASWSDSVLPLKAFISTMENSLFSFSPILDKSFTWAPVETKVVKQRCETTAWKLNLNPYEHRSHNTNEKQHFLSSLGYSLPHLADSDTRSVKCRIAFPQLFYSSPHQMFYGLFLEYGLE